MFLSYVALFANCRKKVYTRRTSSGLENIMRTIEALGITEEVFKKMYQEYSGFDNTFNKNHPSHDEGEEFLNFLNAGSKKLVNENVDLVVDIIQRG